MEMRECLFVVDKCLLWTLTVPQQVFIVDTDCASSLTGRSFAL